MSGFNPMEALNKIGYHNTITKETMGPGRIRVGSGASPFGTGSAPPLGPLPPKTKVCVTTVILGALMWTALAHMGIKQITLGMSTDVISLPDNRGSVIMSPSSSKPCGHTRLEVLPTKIEDAFF